MRALTFDENFPQIFRIAPVCLCWEMRFEKTVEFYSMDPLRAMVMMMIALIDVADGGDDGDFEQI